MKLTVQDFKNAVILFESVIMDRYSEPADKGALGVAFFDNAARIDEGISKVAEDGMVDCEKMRGRVNAFLKGAGGEFAIPAKVPALARLLGVTIDKIAITQGDADIFFDSIVPSVAQAAGQ